MIGKIFEIVNEVKSDFRSAADNKNYYDEMQRFYKGGNDHDKNTLTEWYLDVIKSRLKGRLSGCLGYAKSCLRKLRFIGGNVYAKVKGKVGCLRKEKRND